MGKRLSLHKKQRPKRARRAAHHVGTCRKCGCTDDDCRQCIEATGYPCAWANRSHTLCTRCA